MGVAAAMTTRMITVLGFVCIGIALLALHLIGRRPGSRVPTAGQFVGFLMRPKAGRVTVLAAWLWLGWHFFAR